MSMVGPELSGSPEAAVPVNTPSMTTPQEKEKSPAVLDSELGPETEGLEDPSPMDLE